MGGAGVHNFGPRIIEQRDGVNRRFVRQAQDDQIRFVQERATRLGILAICVGDAQQFKVTATAETRSDLQTGGAGLSVDEYVLHVGGCP